MDNLTVTCLLIGTNLLSFLGGVYTNAAGGYLAQKFTDQRKSQEKKKDVKDKFDDIKNKFPELISEMAKNTQNDNITTKFIIMPKENISVPRLESKFIYYRTKYENIDAALTQIKTCGFIVDETNVTEKSYSIMFYKMLPDFIKLLQNHKV